MKDGWQTVQLSEVLQRTKAELTIDDSMTYKQVTVRLWNKGVTLRGEQEGIAIKTKRQFYVKTGQLVLSRIDVRNGAIGLVPKELDGAIVSNDFWVYDINEDKLLSKFLVHYVTTPSFTEDANRTSSGTTNRIRADETTFLKIEIPLPPLGEQRRIVERIETLSARIIKAQSLREEAIEEAEAIETSARNEVFGYLARTIKPVRFEEIAEMRLGKMLSQASKVSATPLPYLRNANIQWDRLDLSNVNTMDFNEEEKPTFRLKASDILVCEGGDIGKSAIWNDELPECYFQKALHRIRVNTKITFSRFVLHHIFWAAEQNHFFEIKTQTTIPHLTGVKLKAYKIYLPPLNEQRRIVAYLDSVQARLASLRELQSATGEELSALLPSVLDRAFKGEL